MFEQNQTLICNHFHAMGMLEIKKKQVTYYRYGPLTTEVPFWREQGQHHGSLTKVVSLLLCNKYYTKLLSVFLDQGVTTICCINSVPCCDNRLIFLHLSVHFGTWVSPRSIYHDCTFWQAVVGCSGDYFYLHTSRRV